MARARAGRGLESGKRGGNHRSHRIDEHRDLILGWIDETPDLTLAEVAERLDAVAGYRPLPGIVCRFFQRHDVTRKKKTAHAAEQARTGIARRRVAWFEGQPDLDPERLVFIDE